MERATSTFSVLLVALCFAMVRSQTKQEEVTEFSPTVSANCDKGFMTISVLTEEPFNGIVHTRDTSDPRGIVKELRRSPCIAYGTGGRNTSLRISLFPAQDDPLYCGVRRKQGTEERSVAISIRVHKALELSDDKSYVITCGKNNFRNARNELYRVSLGFLEDQKKVHELVMGHHYTLRASAHGPGETGGIVVRSCFSFASNTSEEELIDANGCPKTTFLSAFKYNETSDTADATVSSTFRFPGSNKINIQCDIVLCQSSRCPVSSCGASPDGGGIKSLPQIKDSESAVQLMASTSVFVVEPGESSLSAPLRECTEWRFPWLIGLCICLAILLLVMLIVNIFLCSSLTCTCTKTEVEEKEPSEMEDYDPYKGSWVPSSQYGSRTSLNKPGYTSGGSTLNSARSVSNGSDHYTIVHSRPNSRYSHHSSKEPLHRNGPGSHLSNGHYNSRI
uniref:ZP domain-containing protein n=1 Tax=Rhipicephalus pulchellus TaxID=72859 RepID=L7M6W3_RHIPC